MRRKLIFEKSRPGRKAYSLPLCDVPKKPVTELIPEEEIREEEPELPEVSEVDLVRHYTQLSRLNHGVDTGFYPLGSCTMKYNPKVHEDLARLDGLANIHPYQPEEMVQGCLEILYRLEGLLAEITGMDRFSLQPAAGAHGELTGMMIIRAFHEHQGDTQRRKIIVPASAHGTNPASAALAGFEILPVASNERGLVDQEALRSIISPQIAGLMLTNPNTLGLFEEEITEIADLLHQAGGLLYYDGANANAILGLSRPGEMGFDVMHLNLHKTFATPHGGGGPGSGPVGVKKELTSFLPLPLVEYQDGRYFADYDRPLSIGRVKSFYGNFGVMIKAYAYIRSLGAEGLRQVSEAAVLNANYLKHKLREFYDLPYEQTCLHELVLSAQRQKEAFGVSAQDIAKRLLDFGFHPPTVYFPLIVKEALMIEPTETESKETLDEFIEAMSQIAREAQTDPEKVREAPHTTAVSRMDETKAARTPVLRWSAKD